MKHTRSSFSSRQHQKSILLLDSLLLKSHSRNYHILTVTSSLSYLIHPHHDSSQKKRSHKQLRRHVKSQTSGRPAPGVPSAPSLPANSSRPFPVRKEPTNPSAVAPLRPLGMKSRICHYSKNVGGKPKDLQKSITSRGPQLPDPAFNPQNLYPRQTNYGVSYLTKRIRIRLYSRS